MIDTIQPSDIASMQALDGAALSFFWALPFCGMLLSLALMPIVAPNFWHHHFGKVAAFWGALTVGMLLYSFGVDLAVHELGHTYLHHFIPFIIFILVLYVVCGGIQVDVQYRLSALGNTLFLGAGTLAASLIGTTGAAMLLIRPLLRINQSRSKKVHLVVFFIFLVCNIGGSLTAIGDPPLFLGFLNGVDFFWPTVHLMGPYLTVVIPLLIIFYGMDRYFISRDSLPVTPNPFLLRVNGKRNMVFLAASVSVIVASGIWKSSAGISVFGIHLTYADVMRDLALLALTGLSLWAANDRVRQENQFTWAPFLEVFKVFAAIFITAAPVLAMLKAGENGAFADLVRLVNTAAGPQNAYYYWITGSLSAVLDNAPTYLVFFNLAGGDAATLMTQLEGTLIAISAGAVFMGAMTYIGNAPNFMVKAIAETHEIEMPSFFGYILWSVVLLLPLFYVVSLFWLFPSPL